MSKVVDDLIAEVARQKTIKASLLALLTGIHDKLKGAGDDPAKIAAVLADLKQNDDEMATAIVANTDVATADEALA